ncbi:hypothetical protein IEQ34_007359 [Dendrobium chrysotoxum]|uniref:Uncharacterized protein n=1 Tax=Dendrobium chrysotoxum TaxID=161865 RepID=A0AAV7HAH5_DENCH|nr:hypothetical protein IEQ34_007359 [Dendrobium chrysotoxum]
MTGQHGFEATRWLAGSPFQAGFLLTTLVPPDADAELLNSSTSPPPPKPHYISSPCEEGEYPVLIFLHEFLLYNSFYSQSFQ